MDVHLFQGFDGKMVPRELTIPVNVSNATSAILRARFSMNSNNDPGVKFNSGSYVYFASGPRPSVSLVT